MLKETVMIPPPQKKLLPLEREILETGHYGNFSRRRILQPPRTQKTLGLHAMHAGLWSSVCREVPPGPNVFPKNTMREFFYTDDALQIVLINFTL